MTHKFIRAAGRAFILSVLITSLALALFSCGDEETPETEQITEKETVFILPAAETESYDHEDLALKGLEKVPLAEGMRENTFRVLTDTVFSDSETPEKREESHRVTLVMQTPDGWYPTDLSAGENTVSKSFLTEGDYFVKLSDSPVGPYSVRYDVVMKYYGVYYFEDGAVLSTNLIRIDPYFQETAGKYVPHPQNASNGEAYIYYTSEDASLPLVLYYPITYDRVACFLFYSGEDTLKSCAETLRCGVGYYGEGENREPELKTLALPDKYVSSAEPVEANDLKEAFDKLAAMEGGLSVSERYTFRIKDRDSLGSVGDYKGYRVEKGEYVYLASVEIPEIEKGAKKDDPRTVYVSFCVAREFPG